MLVSTARTLGIRCTDCGEQTVHSLYLFDFNRSGCLIKCPCGRKLVHTAASTGADQTGTDSRSCFRLEYECPYCGHSHQLQINRQDLTGTKLVPFICPELEIPAAFLGPEETVLQALQIQDQSLEETARELGFVDYFANPEIMYEVLGSLYQIAEGNNLSCSCGNYYIGVEIFADRVELRCSRCGAVAVVSASTADDWKLLQGTREIRLLEGKSQIINPRRRSLR